MDFTAVIIEINENENPCRKEDFFRETMTGIAAELGYKVKNYITLPFDESMLKKEAAKQIDEEKTDLLFVRNRGRYSMNEALFDLEDRSFRDKESWRRSWSRQRILYNEYNHAITVVRDDSFILNFEGEFLSVSEELVDILKMWKENCILQKNEKGV